MVNVKYFLAVAATATWLGVATDALAGKGTGGVVGLGPSCTCSQNEPVSCKEGQLNENSPTECLAYICQSNPKCMPAADGTKNGEPQLQASSICGYVNGVCQKLPDIGL
jgi:hypothetical protein